MGPFYLRWIQAYERTIHTLITKDALAIRQIRHDGFYGWKIPEIISALPLLLQLSVGLFFVGLGDYLLVHHPVVTAAALIQMALTLAFLGLTTLLPGVQMFALAYRQLQNAYRTGPPGSDGWLQCAYWPPQSWLFSRIMLAAIPFFNQCPSLGHRPLALLCMQEVVTLKRQGPGVGKVITTIYWET